ncbi:MAG: SMI1/KNR4 family protein [Armatimonadota bacterium]
MASTDDIANIEANTGVLLPKVYCTFLLSFGPVYTPDILDIVVLRKSPIVAVQEFLAPADVIESSQTVAVKGCVAFANDCSGNLFCFKRLPKAEPHLDDAPIWLLDHETGRTSKVAPSFDAWLSNFTQLQPLLQDRQRGTAESRGDYLYQVIIQFPSTFFVDDAAIEAFGERIAESMPRTHEYDGHDAGSGTVNYFLYSNTPNAILTNFRKYLGTNKVEKKVRIAYRSIDNDIWTNLWPKRDTRPFDYSY